MYIVDPDTAEAVSKREILNNGHTNSLVLFVN